MGAAAQDMQTGGKDPLADFKGKLQGMTDSQLETMHQDMLDRQMSTFNEDAVTYGRKREAIANEQARRINSRQRR